VPNVLDQYGLQIKTFDEITSEIKQAWKDGISQELDVEDESELGQIADAVSVQLREALELIQAGYNSQDPAQGSGFGQNQVASVTGTIRAAATYSVDFLDLSLNAGTYAPGTLIVYVSGQPDVRFANKYSVTSPGGTVAAVEMWAETAGRVRAPAGTLTTIAETVTGFNSVVSDPSDATVGSPAESDTALRLRRVDEIYRRGSTNANAIRADLITLTGVTYCAVLENDTDATDANGLPPHSVECIVDGTATAAAIRAQIYASKAVGIQAYGTSSGTITDSSGNAQTIAYSTPTLVPVTLLSAFTYLSNVWASAADAQTAVQDAIADAFASWQLVGRDVLYRRLVSAALAVPGVVDCAVLVNGSAANFVIAVRERATIGANVAIPSAISAAP